MSNWNHVILSENTNDKLVQTKNIVFQPVIALHYNKHSQNSSPDYII